MQRSVSFAQNRNQPVQFRSVHATASTCYPRTTDDAASAKALSEKQKQTARDVRILSELSQHLWPNKSRPNSGALKARVVAAVSLLVASKIINIQVPFLFKMLVDSFEVTPAALAAASSGGPEQALLLASPLAIVLGYGAARSAAAAAAELRSAIFATVAHDAIRQVSRDVFVHLHNLDMQVL